MQYPKSSWTIGFKITWIRFKLVQGFRYFNVYGDGEDHKEDQASPVLNSLSKLKTQEHSNYLKDLINSLETLYV